ncbi:hypothetical protein EDD15DRAFT_2214117 [Pisolithus albus]|nr:hypothetical protein EDD15DRAFT_2214117 [Pisolithus albus]
MAQRRSPHRVSTSSPISSKVRSRKYSLRHLSAAKRALAFVNRIQHSSINSHASRASASSSDSALSIRPILATVQPNLRRLPSRQNVLYKNSMRDTSQNVYVSIGLKRKRVVSANENTHAHGRPARGSGRHKRFKSNTPQNLESDDDEGGSMDIDSQLPWGGGVDSDADTDDAESSDEYLISEAPPRQLLRLRKDELVRLYNAAGLVDDPDSFTKPELVEAIVAARDDVASLPPSSPPARPDSISSDYSSDDGNVAGDEGTDIGVKYRAPFGLRRRATVNCMSNMDARSLNTRILPSPDGPTTLPKLKTELNGAPRRKNARSVSSRSSPPPSCANTLPSPPATRHRRNKSSKERVSPQGSHTRCKSKAKQVGFDEGVEVQSPIPSAEESELTDLSELEKKIGPSTTGPRRLRSRGKGNGRTRCIRQTSSEVDHELVEDDEEVDELISSPSPTPPPPQGRQTPVKRRLRPRRVQCSEGDDEGDPEEPVNEPEVEGDTEENGVEGVEEHEIEEDVEEDDVEEDDDEFVTSLVTPAECEPRKLRSGKVVGGEGPRDDVDQEDNEGDEIDLEVESVDLDAECVEDLDEEEDEAVDHEDFDLTLATKKSLVRLRRDDLVRLCETRDLEVAGTKPQLAQSLLQVAGSSCKWFLVTVFYRHSPSLHLPVRVRGHRRTKSKSPPVLMRSHRLHQDEPRTPPASNLDLESLGLEDREIPSDKLTKLEKIGSGGFKDVYIGRFKGRRVAIAEFRDQLSSMDIKELKLLGGFNHPNIVRFLGVSLPENPRESPVMIVSELCANGDLFDYVRNVPPPSLYKVLNIMLDIARGLEYLHMRKPSVIHRDCKSSQDFGLAKVKQSTRSMVRSLVGTVNWQAPELWHAHPKYNHKVDVFSCGLVYWEVLQWHLPNKKFPWEGMNEHAIYEAVGAKRQRPSISGLKKQWCPEILDLIERMWAQDPGDRPTMIEVVQELERLLTLYR